MTRRTPHPTLARGARHLPRLLVALSVLGGVATSGADPARRTFTIAPPPQLLGQAAQSPVSTAPVPNAPFPTAPLPGAALSAQPPRAMALDPTRPPPGLANPARASNTAGAGFLALPAPATPPVRAPSVAPAPAQDKPRLQALQLPANGEPSALVDGQILKIGDRLGDLSVADIGADGIVMKGPRGKETWPLIPTDKRRTPQRVASPPEQEPAPKGAPATTVAGRKEH